VPALRVPMIESDDEALPQTIAGLAIGNGFGDAFYYANQSQIYLLVPGQLDELASKPPVPRRFATVFSHARRTLADVIAHLRRDDSLGKLDWTEHDANRATVTGAGYSLTLARNDAKNDVKNEVKALPHGQDEAGGAVSVFSLSGVVDPSYAEAAYT